jgi:uncharacterized protein (TIGR00255 family)
MTGFGAAQGRLSDVQITVEVRSVNHRHLDVRINAPREYGAAEAELRKVVSETVGRGRADVYIGRGMASRSRAVAVQRDLVAAYVKAWRQLKRDFDLAGDVDLALLQGRSELFQSETPAVDPEAELKVVRKLLVAALEVHTREREREGSHLKRDMTSRGRALSALQLQMRKRTRDLVSALKERLERRLATLLTQHQLDPARVAQEAALLADRCDVTEELVRIESHLASLRDLLAAPGQVGKRIEFLLQEIGREFSTVGAKANDLEMTRLTLDAKAEVEKLREQVQNVE